MATVMPLEQLVEQIRTGLITIHTDSRKVQDGDVFIALPGTAVDGARFIPDVIKAGASWIVCREQDVPSDNCQGTAFVVTENPRDTLGLLAGIKFGTASLPFPLVGVTGTNGKTTVTYLLEHLFGAAGRKTGVIGTVSYRWPDNETEASMTTPDCIKIHSLLSRMIAAEVDVAFMEVSSHALHQNRTAGITYGGAVITNLTQDHLDYHGNMEAYYEAKASLFTNMPNLDKPCAINIDDSYGRRLLADVPTGIGFTLHGNTMPERKILQGNIVSCTAEGLHLRMNFDGNEWELRSSLVGEYNASNLLAAQAVGLGLGLDSSDMQGLESFTGVPGRLERIVNDKGIHAFVDYAHTPDALDNVLTGLREVGFPRIITVFGCGGNRDKTKRPLMGEAVCRHTDIAVLTSDNPRHEEPLAIMQDVKPGLRNCTHIIEEQDRRTAIAMAVEAAREGDCILVAGKGHEEYQQVGDEKHPFSDQQVLREMLR